MLCQVGNMNNKHLFEYHSILVEEILKLIRPSFYNRIIEFGSGSGLFTIPLINRLYDKMKEFIIVDPFPKPYLENKEILLRRIKETHYDNKVILSEIPAWEMNKEFSDVDLIIGHDVFCDLSREQIKEVLESGNKTLNRNGIFVHSGLSPNATSEAERLLIELDMFSSTPLIEDNWFSPNSKILIELTRDIGFEDIYIQEIKIPFKLYGEEALLLIKEWNIREEVVKKFERDINEIGIEFPKEQILVCKASNRTS